jgi:hypothetical protein
VYKPRKKETAKAHKSGLGCVSVYMVCVYNFLVLFPLKGKSGDYAKNFLLVTALDGSILSISEPFLGPPHDQSQWNEENLRSLFVGKPYGALFDAGFTPNTIKQSKNNSIIAFRTLGTKTFEKATQAQQNMSHLVSSYRLVIEETIGRMKRWRILGGVFRRYWGEDGDTTQLSQIVRVIAMLTNRSISKKPLRDRGWESPYSIRIREEKLPLQQYSVTKERQAKIQEPEEPVCKKTKK